MIYFRQKEGVTVPREKDIKKTATLTFAIEPQLKEDFIDLCDRLGLTHSTACVLFVNQMLREQALPFTPSMITTQEVSK